MINENICHFRGVGSILSLLFHFLWMVGWLVGCFGLNGPLRQYFSL